MQASASRTTGRTGRTQLRPVQVIVAAFTAVMLVGTGLLSLPIARTGNGEASFVDALFTATSALSVTSHIVVDTPTYWSGFGLVVILVLVQVGGFGIMTFASVLGLAIVRRMSLTSRITAATEVHSLGLGVSGLLFGIIRITLAVEAVVAVILALRFAIGYGEPPLRAVWLGVFHAIAAFNNAGFSLFSDNLVSFATDPIICVPIAVAVILGGLGFPVLLQLRRYGGLTRRWTMNTRIVLAGTAVLLIAGAAFITSIEWANPSTLGPLTWPEKVFVGSFMSVQSRTAGFNSIDTGSMDPATWLGIDVLMFIGGGPAGTAGGIKITTFAVLFFIVVAELRGATAVNVFGKRLPRSVQRQAIAVALLSVAVVVIATVILVLITDVSTEKLLFETISAFATVGLSTGITGELPDAAKIVLVVVMIIGRLGPITFASALALRWRRETFELPRERPVIG